MAGSALLPWCRPWLCRDLQASTCMLRRLAQTPCLIRARAEAEISITTTIAIALLCFSRGSQPTPSHPSALADLCFSWCSSLSPETCPTMIWADGYLPSAGVTAPAVHPPQAKIPDYQRGYTVLTDHAPDILSDQCGGHTGQLVASERDLNDMANAWNTIVQSALRQSRSKCA